MHTTIAREFTLSQAQINFLGKLCGERGLTSQDIAKTFRRPANNAEFTTIINWVKAQPVKAIETTSPTPAAPQVSDLSGVAPLEADGSSKAWRYALRDAVDGTVKFYRVKRGRKTGYFFVDVQASDETYSIKSIAHKNAILRAIAQDPRSALALYGQEIGSCGRCGRTLTSEYRKLGIGPVCIDK